MDLGGGLMVGALVAVNAIGSVVDPDTGTVIAGPRREDGAGYHDTMKLITSPDFSRRPPSGPINTTIGVVATNAKLTKEQANKLATSAQDGLAMSIRPAHTMGDGDCIFALATGQLQGGNVGMVRLGAAAAMCVSRAILNAVRMAEGLGGIPSIKDLA
jgi:L-aminopeptidase/D-esterase-like protein